MDCLRKHITNAVLFCWLGRFYSKLYLQRRRCTRSDQWASQHSLPWRMAMAAMSEGDFPTCCMTCMPCMPQVAQNFRDLNNVEQLARYSYRTESCLQMS